MGGKSERAQALWYSHFSPHYSYLTPFQLEVISIATEPIYEGKITQILWDWCSGDLDAFNHLITQTYKDLHKVARNLLRYSSLEQSLPPTAMLHELYLRFQGVPKARFENRHQFFSFAATALRHILVDYARSKKSPSSNGGGLSLDLSEELMVASFDPDLVISIHEAFQAFEQVDPRQAKIMELRYFGGLTVEEIAFALEISASTIFREVASAKLWLARHMKNHQPRANPKAFPMG